MWNILLRKAWKWAIKLNNKRKVCKQAEGECSSLYELCNSLQLFFRTLPEGDLQITNPFLRKKHNWITKDDSVALLSFVLKAVKEENRDSIGENDNLNRIVDVKRAISNPFRIGYSWIAKLEYTCEWSLIFDRVLNLGSAGCLLPSWLPHHW